MSASSRKAGGSPDKPDASVDRVYILGLKRRGEDHYGLTTWMGDLPTFRAVYDKNPGFWKDSLKVEPLQIVPYRNGFDIDESQPYTYDGFGWLAHQDGKLYTKEEAERFQGNN